MEVDALGALPAFLGLIGYMDPGNWATCIEAGSRFGCDLIWVMLLAGCVNWLSHYLGRRLYLATGMHLIQACADEFPRGVSLLLCTFSIMLVVSLDSAAIIGSAIGLQLVTRVPLSFGVIPVAVAALSLNEMGHIVDLRRIFFALAVMPGLALAYFFLSSLLSARAIYSGLFPLLTSDSSFLAVALMGSGMLNMTQMHGSESSMGIFMIACSFAIANVVVTTMAARTVQGFAMLTLQDGFLLLESFLGRSAAPLAFGLCLFSAGLLTLRRQHAAALPYASELHSINRNGLLAAAVLSSSYFTFVYGNEGIHQLLVLSKVILALQLPFVLVPLVRLTSSSSFMGKKKITPLTEALAWSVLVLVLGLNVWAALGPFIPENDEWASPATFELSDVRNDTIYLSATSVIVLTTVLMGLLVWLTFMPMKADLLAQENLDLAAAKWDFVSPLRTQDDDASPGSENTRVAPEPESEPAAAASAVAAAASPVFLKAFDDSLVALEPDAVSEAVYETEAVDTVVLEARQRNEKNVHQPVPRTSAADVPVENAGIQLNAGDEDKNQPDASSQQSSAMEELAPGSEEGETFAAAELSCPAATSSSGTVVAAAPSDTDADPTQGEAAKECYVEDTTAVEQVGNKVERQDVPPPVSGAASPVVAEFEAGSSETTAKKTVIEQQQQQQQQHQQQSGSGSLSRLSGLGRAARRQFAALLEEFWSRLFDLHGVPIAPPSATTAPAKLSPSPAPQYTATHSDSSFDPEFSSTKRSSSNSSSSRPLSSYTSYPWEQQPYARAFSHLAASTSEGRYHSLSSSDAYNERRYSSVRHPSQQVDYDYQPATIHGYNLASYANRASTLAASPRSRPGRLLEQSEVWSPRSRLFHLDAHTRLPASPSLQHYGKAFEPASYSNYEQQQQQQQQQDSGDVYSSSSRSSNRGGDASSSSFLSDYAQWCPTVNRAAADNWNPLVYRATGELDLISNSSSSSSAAVAAAAAGYAPIGGGSSSLPLSSSSSSSRAPPLSFDELSPSQSHRDGFSIQASGESLWSKQPFEQLFGPPPGFSSRRRSGGGAVNVGVSAAAVSPAVKRRVFTLPNGAEFGFEVFDHLRLCIGRLLQLEATDWLFRMDNGCDEDLVAGVAAREKSLLESQFSEPVHVSSGGGHSWQMLTRSADGGGKGGGSGGGNCGGSGGSGAKQMVPGVPHCGDTCVWGAALLVSFGVWCVHRILELSLMESRPELWGKYTYVLNRLQGILEPAFCKARGVLQPCMCLQGYPPVGKRKAEEGAAAPLPSTSSTATWSWGRNASNPWGRPASSGVYMEMIREVEAAVCGRKGRTGTAAGDVAFPKGKENLASVLKRYKRRLGSISNSSNSSNSSGNNSSSSKAAASAGGAAGSCRRGSAGGAATGQSP